ncbi:MAG: 23S rRNA (adenine(2503)-C(2))-methyltransferase RlmN [Pseudomonadota bacterium]
MLNLYGQSRTQLEALFVEQGLQAFRGRQLMRWIYHLEQHDFQAMTDLPLWMREWLAQNACIELPDVVQQRVSKDGTCKWVLDVGDGNLVETVLIPEKGRNTLCISSQIGCLLDCRFCSTGKQGFSGNLSAATIVGQMVIANDYLKPRGEQVTNVVMMGMGEPLLNFDEVLPALSIMMDDLAFGLSKRRVTVSTAGVVPGIYKLAEATDCALAISLHAPTDELRDELVPINKKHPIAQLMEACLHYVDHLGRGRKLVMEYTLLKGVNDSKEHAQALAKLLEPLRCKINLIPFNPFPGSGYEKPSKKAIYDFQTCLMKAGYTTMLRTTRGDDIDAACGQLVGQVADRTKRQARYHAKLDAQGITPVRLLDEVS